MSSDLGFSWLNTELPEKKNNYSRYAISSITIALIVLGIIGFVYLRRKYKNLNSIVNYLRSRFRRQPLLVVTGAWNSNVLERQSSIAWSDDGTNWLRSDDFFGNVNSSQGNAVAFNGQMWVAGGQGTNSLAYSFDGRYWMYGTDFFRGAAPVEDDPGICTAIAWSEQQQLWVAVGTGTDGPICTSKDGMVWTQISQPLPALLVFQTSRFARTVIWCKELNLWLCGGKIEVTVPGIPTTFTSVGFIFYSSDAQLWQKATVTGGANIFPSGECRSILWTGTNLVCIGNGDRSVYTSANGKVWTASTQDYFNAAGDPSGVGAGLATNGNQIIAVGNQYTGSQKVGTIAVATNRTGSTWSKTGVTDFFVGGEGFSVVWAGTFWVAVGKKGSAPNTTNTIGFSTNGLTWTAANDDFFAKSTAVSVATSYGY